MDKFRSYIEETRLVLDNLSLELDNIEKVRTMIVEAERVYVVGNGGSMTMAMHFAEDLVKVAGVRAFSMCDVSLLTAYSNDDNYRNVFSLPLKVLVTEKDVVICISTSGMSQNLISCVDVPCPKIGIVGRRGSRLQLLTDSIITLDTDNVQVAEDVFSLVCHILTNLVADKKNQKEVE